MSANNLRLLRQGIRGQTENSQRLVQAASGLKQLQEYAEPGYSLDSGAFDELHPDTAFLNQTYLQEVEARRLKVVPEILDWMGYRVRVFLRHEKNFVFAIAFHNSVGMANHVVLRNARFEVDPIGRRQTLERRGPLPNGATVHAWISGILDSAGNDHPEVNNEFEPVLYRPVENEHFFRADSLTPVQSSCMVHCLPGSSKVWVPKSNEFRRGDSQ